MIPPGQSPVPPPQDAAAAVAAVALARAKLVALALQAGQVIDARVLGPGSNGLTQLAIAGQTFNVKLPSLLPPGTVLQVQVQPGTGQGPPLLVVQPPATASAPPSPLQPPTAPIAIPLAAATPPSRVMASAVATLPQAPIAPPPGAVAPAVAVAQAGMTAPLAPAPTTAVPPQGTASAPIQSLTVATATPPSIAAPPAASVAAAGSPAAALPAATTSPVAPAGLPATARGVPSAPATGRPAPTPGIPAPLTAQPALPPLVTMPAPQPHRAPPLASLPASAASPPPGSAASAALGLATQAAARQDSIGPLLQNLAVLQGRIAQFPRPVAEAALRLLAGRLVVGTVPPSAGALKLAVLQSGVFVHPAATPTSADLRSSLLLLRGALMKFLGAGITPVAPVARRPPPPTREGQPRAMRTELPSLPEGAPPREAGRALLHQADAALSRVRLLQLASQPADAGRAGAPAAATDWTVEVPMLLGHEMAVAQLRVSRDGQGPERKRERGWQLRFSVHFSVLGEVGAQVGLDGKVTSIALWAEEPATAAVLEEMLPELGPALAARGLEVGALRVGCGVPGNRQQRAGQFMDHLK